MGATKRLAELIIQGFADQARENETGKKFSMVRFGNVLRSSGSVVPLFESQIIKGGPVTVTHPETTRYFMTCGEASELVIQACAMSVGGEIFVLDMGEPVLIKELAEKMIHLHGSVVGPATDTADKDLVIDINYIGLRPGEKLTEELVIGANMTGTRHPKILQAREDGIRWESLEALCDELISACREADYPTVKRLLEDRVAGYKMADESYDRGFSQSRQKPDDSKKVVRLDDHKPE
jgi:FlaA1/EpsC-like NDP-sugar epimerase